MFCVVPEGTRGFIRRISQHSRAGLRLFRPGGLRLDASVLTSFRSTDPRQPTHSTNVHILASAMHEVIVQSFAQFAPGRAATSADDLRHVRRPNGHAAASLRDYGAFYRTAGCPNSGQSSIEAIYIALRCCIDANISHSGTRGRDPKWPRSARLKVVPSHKTTWRDRFPFGSLRGYRNGRILRRRQIATDAILARRKDDQLIQQVIAPGVEL